MVKRCYLFHRASAALFAIIFRLRSDSDAARANPPLDAPSFDKATAAGFFSRSGSSGSSGDPSIFSPMRSSTTERARRFGSRGRFGLLAREGMVGLSHKTMTAREKLNLNLSDVDELIVSHEQITGGGKGKPEKGKGAALTRAGIVLLAAAMEAFVEDLFKEAVPRRYPSMSEKQRKYLIEQTADKLNQANYDKTCFLYFNLGFPWVLEKVCWQKFSNNAFKKSLNQLVEKRNSIAHGNRPDLPLQRLREWRKMVPQYADKLLAIASQFEISN